MFDKKSSSDDSNSARMHADRGQAVAIVANCIIIGARRAGFSNGHGICELLTHGAYEECGHLRIWHKSEKESLLAIVLHSGKPRVIDQLVIVWHMTFITSLMISVLPVAKSLEFDWHLLGPICAHIASLWQEYLTGGRRIWERTYV